MALISRLAKADGLPGPPGDLRAEDAVEPQHRRQDAEREQDDLQHRRVATVDWIVNCGELQPTPHLA
jgi:hypothetical protein